jgi:hypothetical protein
MDEFNKYQTKSFFIKKVLKYLGIWKTTVKEKKNILISPDVSGQTNELERERRWIFKVFAYNNNISHPSLVYSEK